MLPRSVGLLLILGTLAEVVLPKLGGIDPSLDPLWVVGFVLFGAAVAWLGYALWSGTPDRIGVRQPRIMPTTNRLAADLR